LQNFLRLRIVQIVPWKPDVTLKTRLYLENKTVPWKQDCTLKTRLYLDNQIVPWKPDCTLKTRGPFLKEDYVPVIAKLGRLVAEIFYTSHENRLAYLGQDLQVAEQSFACRTRRPALSPAHNFLQQK
jgi:hypothetical protein